jgi:hypothetical protein
LDILSHGPARARKIQAIRAMLDVVEMQAYI